MRIAGLLLVGLLGTGCAAGIQANAQFSVLKKHPVAPGTVESSPAPNVLTVQGWLATIGEKKTRDLLVQTLSETDADTLIAEAKSLCAASFCTAIVKEDNQ